MKMRNVVFAAVAAVAAGTTAKAEVSARVWMLDHSDPNSDELSELRTENPDAYALVKALLTKRSLGLLDPKHPTASFSKPAPEEEGSHPVGAAVYAKFATTDKERQALAGAEPAYDTSSVEDEVVTPAPSGSHDWLSWKPADSAASDDAMVQNVLGSVAGLMGKKVAAPSAPSAPAQPSAGALDADEAAILSSDDAKPAAQPAPQQATPPTQNFLAKAPEVPQAPKQSNSYLDGLDLTSDTKPDAPPAVAQPVVVDTPVAPVAAVDSSVSVSGGKSALDSFSFSDSDDQTTTAAPKVQTPAPKASALGSWLGMVQPHVQKAAAPVDAAAAAPVDSNPYLTDLQ
jgi:hypothetical protein